MRGECHLERVAEMQPRLIALEVGEVKCARAGIGRIAGHLDPPGRRYPGMLAEVGKKSRADIQSLTSKAIEAEPLVVGEQIPGLDTRKDTLGELIRDRCGGCEFGLVRPEPGVARADRLRQVAEVQRAEQLALDQSLV